MVMRSTYRQSEHDVALHVARDIYRKYNKVCWINPDGEKNKIWGSYYIDIIAANTEDADIAWVTELETEDSVTEHEAENQWKRYSGAYKHWYLAVPVGACEEKALLLLKANQIENCTVITWKCDEEHGTCSFSELPGI